MFFACAASLLPAAPALAAPLPPASTGHSQLHVLFHTMGHPMLLALQNLQAAFVMVQASRQQLRSAAEEVAAQIQVVGATRKKQRLMGALELASKVKKAKELHLLLKWVLKGLVGMSRAAAWPTCDCVHQWGWLR